MATRSCWFLIRARQCVRIEEVGVQGRNTQGVRIIRLKDSENLVSLARIAEPEAEEFIEGEEGETTEAVAEE